MGYGPEELSTPLPHRFMNMCGELSEAEFGAAQTALKRIEFSSM